MHTYEIDTPLVWLKLICVYVSLRTCKGKRKLPTPHTPRCLLMHNQDSRDSRDTHHFTMRWDLLLFTSKVFYLHGWSYTHFPNLPKTSLIDYCPYTQSFPWSHASKFQNILSRSFIFLPYLPSFLGKLHIFPS